MDLDQKKGERDRDYDVDIHAYEDRIYVSVTGGEIHRHSIGYSLSSLLSAIRGIDDKEEYTRVYKELNEKETEIRKKYQAQMETAFDAYLDITEALLRKCGKEMEDMRK